MPSTRCAVVGAGPSCTYVLERLAATATAVDTPFRLELHVYDRSGEFGAGETHSSLQPATSFLNRIVGQVGFAADESVVGAGPLLPAHARPTLLEWCRQRFTETGDPAFDLAAEDWPKRYVHGLALRDRFAAYLELLRADPRVEVHLHPREVVDLVESGDRLQVVTDGDEEPLEVDEVLMVTGHSTNDPDRTSDRTRLWSDFARRHGTRFVSSAYPLEHGLGLEDVPPDKVVGVSGMGLTAIDVVLYLTEGRGGTYARDADGRPAYRPSGLEPASIVVTSDAGLFTFARPFNAKERDLARYEHRGRFLTEAAVDRLRETCGRPREIGGRERRQLDFERHLLPVVVLEMAQLHHATLLGPDAGRWLEEVSRPGYERFLREAGWDTEPEAATAALLAPGTAAVTGAAAAIDAVLRGEVPYRQAAGEPRDWSFEAAYARYLEVVFGPAGAERVLTATGDPAGTAAAVRGLSSPTGHATYCADNLFSWPRTIRPVPAERCGSPEEYRRALIEFMVLDHRRAAQDNLTNPVKAAADGVWRDLRPVLAYAVDFGGLTAESHRVFLERYLRQHNRLANGAALQVMEKMLALIEHGLLDVGAGPGARVDGDESTGRFVVTGPVTGARRTVDVLVDARVHPFHPEADTRPIYPNLLARGLVRKWRNPGADGGYEPGGLDLTPGFHPVRADGRVDERLTFLGPPSEGVMFFQLGALRPQHDHHVMHDVLTWVTGFWDRVRRRAGAPRPAGAAR